MVDLGHSHRGLPPGRRSPGPRRSPTRRNLPCPPPWPCRRWPPSASPSARLRRLVLRIERRNDRHGSCASRRLVGVVMALQTSRGSCVLRGARSCVKSGFTRRALLLRSGALMACLLCQWRDVCERPHSRGSASCLNFATRGRCGVNFKTRGGKEGAVWWPGRQVPWGANHWHGALHAGREASACPKAARTTWRVL